jgi:hypothetical protein
MVSSEGRHNVFVMRPSDVKGRAKSNLSCYRLTRSKCKLCKWAILQCCSLRNRVRYRLVLDLLWYSARHGNSKTTDRTEMMWITGPILA